MEIRKKGKEERPQGIGTPERNYSDEEGHGNASYFHGKRGNLEPRVGRSKEGARETDHHRDIQSRYGGR